MSNKSKYIKKVVDSLVGESKLKWKPTKLTFHRDGGWRDVRVSVPFNNHSLTSSNYFRGEGTHQQLFKSGFINFTEDTYALSKGETYFVYELYLKEMYTRISYFIKENTIDDEPNENPFAINEENIFKKYGRKLYSKYSKILNVSEKFVEKMAKYIEQHYDEVINVTWTYDIYQKIEFKVYIDEDDGQRTDIGVHPLEEKIKRELPKDWHIGMDKDSHLWYYIKVINLNKDTKLRSSVKESINEEYNKKYNLRESRKDIKREQDDIERSVQDLNRHHNFNVSYDDIVKEIKKSTPEKITDEVWGDLQNTESNKIQFGDFNTVFNLSNKYNKSNPLKLKKKIENNEYKYPIIVRFNDQFHLVSGNTRLCTAAAMGEYLDVIIADINKPFPVDENKKYKKNNI